MATLTAKQEAVARELRMARPMVYPGTRVIMDAFERKAWYDQVYSAMNAQSIAPNQVNAFCDLAGVPD